MFTSVYLSKYFNLVKAMDSKHPVIERADFFFSYFPQLIKNRKLILQVINRSDIRCFPPRNNRKIINKCGKRH